MAKRSSGTGDSSDMSKHGKTGIDSKWNTDFPRMLEVDNGQGLCAVNTVVNRRKLPSEKQFG